MTVPSIEPARAPPTSRTRSPTRKGRVLCRTMPAKIPPSACWAASPSRTAVKAPPTARVPALTPAIRSAMTTTAVIASSRTTNPVVPAVAGSRRR